MTSTAMNASTRTAALQAMQDEELDLLVIGGGVTGAGIALDAVSRGLNTGIVEAQDWADGTSSRSSKLVHGGLRYLQQLDFKLVSEALRERELLLHTLAPHLVKPVSFLYPLQHRVWERPYVTAGVGLYDTMAHVGSKVASMPFHKHLSAKGVRRAFPDLRPDAMVGAVKYWDGRVDDARLVLTLVRTAVDFGAHAASRTRVVGLDRDETGRVVGARVEDLESGTRMRLRAKRVVAAAGVWTEQAQQLANADGGLKVLASKGIHIVVDRDRIDGDCGIIAPTEKSVLFVIPWDRYWVIGTTDTPYERDLTHPVADADDIDYVLEHANALLARPLTRNDVVGTWAGLRPLLQPGTTGDQTATTKVSREHTVTEAAPGFVTIAGGKLTTYRVMAQDAVDLALGQEARQRPSNTEHTPLLGGPGYQALAAQADRLGARHGLDRERIEHLLGRYGTMTRDLLAMMDDRPDLARPLQHAPGYLRAEIAYGCTHEGALHLSDLLVSRTRLTYEVRDGARAAVPEIADLAGELLGWDATARDAEIAAYDARIEAEQAAAAPAGTDVEAGSAA